MIQILKKDLPVYRQFRRINNGLMVHFLKMNHFSSRMFVLYLMVLNSIARVFRTSFLVESSMLSRDLSIFLAALNRDPLISRTVFACDAHKISYRASKNFSRCAMSRLPIHSRRLLSIIRLRLLLFPTYIKLSRVTSHE